MTVEGGGSDDVLLYRASYDGGAAVKGISDHHLLVINAGRRIKAWCKVGTVELDHACEPGNVTVIPAETEWSARLAPGMDQIIVAIPAPRLAMAAARSLEAGVQLRALLRGQDGNLVSIVREMVGVATRPAGAAWHLLADELSDTLVNRHQRNQLHKQEALLDRESLSRINQFVSRRLTEQIAIDELADVARRGRANFARTFRRTLGMSPHQYVTRVRLAHARLLIANGLSLAEAAADAGFSDQSHLTNWMRRIYGVTPGRL